ncbi:MAG: hypothetical protein QM820_34500 [Minicystis sp.]
MKKLAFPALAALALVGCYADDPLPPPPEKTVITGDLDVDIREKAHVELTTVGTDVTVSVSLTKGYGIAPAASEIKGTARVEAFPEADLTLYTARLDAPADPSGPCGMNPVSLALSLHRRGKDAHVGGSLTAYCGAGVSHGTPARLLRLAGDMPLK